MQMSFSVVCRFQRHRRLQIKIDPWPNMDAHLALFHLDAHVGRRRWQPRRQRTYAQATVRNQLAQYSMQISVFFSSFIFLSPYGYMAYR